MLAKLVPAGDRYELRVKGPNIMPGYYRDPEATAEAFDEEGFFKTGDAARWVDESRPEAGIAFAGRLSEEFKLSSGTWVRATTLRTQLIDALQPYVRDLVIAAPDKPWLGALVWLDATACAEAGGEIVWRPALERLLAAFKRPAGRFEHAHHTVAAARRAAECRRRRDHPTSARSTGDACWNAVPRKSPVSMPIR
jgi:feruloyl-CoA synthase